MIRWCKHCFSWRISRLISLFFSSTLALLAGALRKRGVLAIYACGTILEYEFSSRIMYPSKQIQSIDCYQTFHDIFPKDCILWYTLLTELCKVSSSMFRVLLRFHKHINFFFFSHWRWNFEGTNYWHQLTFPL